MSFFFKKTTNSTRGDSSLISRALVKSASFAPTLLLFFVLFGLAIPHEVQAAATWNPLTWPGAILGGVAKEFAEGAGKLFASFLFVLVQLMAGLLFVVGMGLNWVVLVTVFQFSTYFGNSSGMLLAWTTLRDLANIILLFGFVWIGLQTILNVGHHFSVGKALPRLLIFAILINFSLFISEAIVDVANVFTAVMYEQAGSMDCKQAANQVECVNIGISGNVIGAIGFSSLLSPGAFDTYGTIWNDSTDPGQAILAGFLSLIFMIVLVTVFLAASIMLLIRSIVLIFVLVLSPLGFVGMAVPQFEEQAQKWWKMLISNAFFAPVLFLLLFISLKIMEGAKATFGQGVSFADAVMSPGVNMGGILILFGLMIGFLIFSLIAAKSMGAFGAEFATNTAGKMTGAMTFGAGAAVGRKFIGSWANNQAERMKAEGKHRTPEGMRQIARFEAMAKGSYDLRQAKIAGVDVGKKAAGFARIDFGEGKKGGIVGEIHEKEEMHKKFAASLKNTAEESRAMNYIDTQIAEKKIQDQQELNDLEATQTVEAQPLKDALADRKREAAEARATGNRAAMTLAETALSNATSEFNELRKTQELAKKNMEDSHKQWIATQEVEKKKISEAPQRQYSARLSAGPQADFLGDRGNRILKMAHGMTTSSVAEHHAAEAILKDLKKDQNQRLLEALTGVQSSLNKPAPATAASAPAAGGDGHH